jgi:hypothetical protein
MEDEEPIANNSYILAIEEGRKQINKKRQHEIKLLINTLNRSKSKIETLISNLEKEIKV